LWVCTLTLKDDPKGGNGSRRKKFFGKSSRRNCFAEFCNASCNDLTQLELSVSHAWDGTGGIRSLIKCFQFAGGGRVPFFGFYIERKRVSRRIGT
jgi:hypothetical protein